MTSWHVSRAACKRGQSLSERLVVICGVSQQSLKTFLIIVCDPKGVGALQLGIDIGKLYRLTKGEKTLGILGT